MFTTYPSYPIYRPLKVQDPVLKGEDVFALQQALNEVNNAGLDTDGILGKATGAAIVDYQQEVALTDPTIGSADGIAGTLTQRSLSLAIASRVSHDTGVRFAAFKGQLEFESQFRPGIYSPLHNAGTTKQSWDSGVVQENSLVTFGGADTLAERVERAFTPLTAVHDLAARVVEYRDGFKGVADADRRLQLAQGSWNAPAWASFIAYEEGAKSDWVRARKSRELTPTQRATIETYMAHVAAYYI